MYSGFVLVLGCLLSHAVVASPARRAPPTVTLDSATVTGTALSGVNKFLGIPFAQPPTGTRRFRKPQPIPTYTQSFTALNYGKACPQQDVALNFPGLLGIANGVLDLLINTVWRVVQPESEDCLTINVITPPNATPASKLPVVVWFHNGAFQFGSTSTFDGGPIVLKSIALGEPVIYVSMNYRVSAFGFLAGQEVKDQGEANFGLHDQREALRWVQKYIVNFGGDPAKVTIWGESSGAVSVTYQMIANDGNHEGLFRGAVIQSGTPGHFGDLALAQRHYDKLVSDAGCAGQSNTLECLRALPFARLKAAVNKSPSVTGYTTLALPWLPRTDGTFITRDALKSVQQGKIANIPYITGNCDDEGSVFGLASLNDTTTADVRNYIKNLWLPNISDADLNTLMSFYPGDITQGSPYDTGILNALGPQFKRVSAFLGDVAFHAPRRLFVDQSPTSNKWMFLSKRLKATPFLGSYHASDLLNSYGGGDLVDYIVHFVNNLDPNGSGITPWPKYSSSRQVLTLRDSILFPRSVGVDTFRQDAISFLTGLISDNRI